MWSDRAEGAGGFDGEGQDGAVVGFEPAPFGVGELARGKREGGEVLERRADGFELSFEARSEGPERRERVGTWTDYLEGVGEKGSALARCRGGAEGRHQHFGLAALERVALGGTEKRLLVRHRDRGERGRADGLVVGLARGLGAEAEEEGVPARDPALAAAEKTRGCDRGQTVVAYERADDPRLVHGGHGPRRGVGAEHERLGFDRIASPLDHDRGIRIASLVEALEPPEAVDDLEGAIALGHDPKRHWGQRNLLEARALRSAESGEARPQSGERDLGHSGRTGPGVDELVAGIL